MTVSKRRCPGCDAVDSRVHISALGGRWKVLCSACGYRYDENDEPNEDEEVTHG
jgi:hypothetical protein